MTDQEMDQNSDLPGPSARTDSLGGARRRRLAGTAAVLAVVGVVLGVTDPFSGPAAPGSATTDNSYPTSVATVSERALSSQTSVSATLGYSGSYDVSLHTGTDASVVDQARSTAQAAEKKVANDKIALDAAESLAKPQDASTLLAARDTVTTDEHALSQANAQLSADVALGCPASSSATVTTPLNSSNSSTSPSSNSPSSSGPTGNTGTTNGHLVFAGASHASVSTTGSATAAPTVTTGAATALGTTADSLSATVDPGGLDTTYHFEWGTTSSFGNVTPTSTVSGGAGVSSVTGTITGLKPATTYEFAIVATNSLGTTVGSAQTFESAASSCDAERAVVTTDAAALREAKDALAIDELGGNTTVNQDQQQLATDESTASAAEQALATAQSQLTNSHTTFTSLASAGQTLGRGDAVYALDAHPVPLFLGSVTPYRALYLGVSAGSDVTELNANLIALGYSSIAGPHFSVATENAVKSWQHSLGNSATGVVALGDIVVEPEPIRVEAVDAKLGQSAQPGSTVLAATATTRVVTIALDAAQQGSVKVGDPVTITLPDNSTTAGVVTSVGTVATTPPSSGNAGNTGSGSSSATITVIVTPTDPRATGSFDQAPVEVSIVNASVEHALVVPVGALLALSGGGYALEVIGAGNVHHLLPITTGIFDDADGLVQVIGTGVVAGERVVVPGT